MAIVWISLTDILSISSVLNSVSHTSTQLNCQTIDSIGRLDFRPSPDLTRVQVPIPTCAIPTGTIPTSTIPTVPIPTCHYSWQNSTLCLKKCTNF